MTFSQEFESCKTKMALKKTEKNRLLYKSCLWAYVRLWFCMQKINIRYCKNIYVFYLLSFRQVISSRHVISFTRKTQTQDISDTQS